MIGGKAYTAGMARVLHSLTHSPSNLLKALPAFIASPWSPDHGLLLTIRNRGQATTGLRTPTPRQAGKNVTLSPSTSSGQALSKGDNNIFSTFLLAFAFLLAGSQNAMGAWSTNPTLNNAISTPANDQHSPTIISDGSGGAIITWMDYRSDVATADIYAQRINSSGVVQWTADGVAISTATYDQYTPTITSDGSGGAIITWYDFRSGTNWDIYAQRINSSGVVQWTADGVAISTAADHQYSPTITSDGSGGAIITWYDSRSGSADIYAQRIDANGTIHTGWTADGVAISTALNNQYTPTIISDGSGGAIITWQDFRSGAWDIYAQRIDANGTIHTGWTADGVAISTAANDQQKPTIISDGSGGAIITWQDSLSSTNWDIYAQRIDANGTIHTGWTADGVAISTAAGNQVIPTIISDGSGGAIITWEDWPSVLSQ